MPATLDRVETRLTPSGHLEVSGPDEVAAAFGTGRGAGLLHLAVSELGTWLPPELAWWRDLGQAWLTRACAALDPTEPTALVLPEFASSELAARIQAAPPMQGDEFLTPALVVDVLRDLGEALTAAVGRGGLQDYLRRHGAVWNVVGRVCLNLAENRKDPERPFAFLATYVHRVSSQARPQHLPLRRALQDYAGARDQLLTLLAPLSRAAEESSFLRELVDSGDIYHPVPFTAAEAHRFLSEAPLYERAGLVVRTPDWWKRRPRPTVSVSVGEAPPSKLGLDALLDFAVSVTLDGEELSGQEMNELLAAGEGLVLIKGRWVEVDRGKLAQVLDQWKDVQRQAQDGGLSFGEALRLLSGTSGQALEAPDETCPEWSQVVAGRWLGQQLEALRSPQVQAEIEANAGLQATLRPYQKLGVQWLTTLRGLGLGGCLADDMGLGKTIQVLGMLSLARDPGTDLLVVPASLVDNWRLEIERFAPQLRVLVAHPSRLPSAELKALPRSQVEAHDAVITTYGTLATTDWMRDFAWRHLILDEAQAIKNPGARQTRAVKSLTSRWRLALTGTPVENRLGDLWSIFDFLNPGLLGSSRAFGQLCKTMAAGREGYAPLRRLVQPYIMRRLKTDRSVIDDLPDKTEVNAWCHLTRRQAALYQQGVEELGRALRERDGIERRGIVLSYLLRFKQICNHPSQWLGDGAWDPDDSGKLARLRELCEPIAARQDKLLVFTQFRELTEPLAGFLAGIFGRPGLVLHGGTPVGRRQGLVKTFQGDERVPFMVLSLKAGGTGLNLTAASHVIHFDRWWNPAVENQATDRAFRLGQKRNVLVHKFVCRGTVEERIDELIASKQKLSEEILEGGAETRLTELSDKELLAMVSLDLRSAVEGG